MGLRLRGGVWYLRKNIDGKRIEVSTGYREGQRAKAELAANRIITNLLDQKHGLAPKEETADAVPTFGEWAKTYAEVYSVQKSKPGRDESIIDYWKTIPIGTRTWADTPLDRFTQTTCEAALQHRRSAGTLNPGWKQQREVSESTVQRERGLIQAMFERARKDRLITDNPFEGIEKEADEIRARLLSADDEVKLMAAFDSFLPGPKTEDSAGPRWKRMVTFLLETGLRLDELRKIEPRDITTTYVHVHGKGRKRRTRCGVCKREGGKCRNVPLTRLAQTTLATQREAEGQLWPQDPSRLREVIANACKKAGISHISPHDLRHSFGWRWLQRGGDIYTLSKVLGHSSVSVTQRNYGHLLDADIDRKMRQVMEGVA